MSRSPAGVDTTASRDFSYHASKSLIQSSFTSGTVASKTRLVSASNGPSYFRQSLT